MWMKWKLMVTTLPMVLAALGVKLIIERVFDFEGVIEFSDVGLVLTGGVFLIGFMLAGTMADYKESEKLPGELAGNLEAIEDLLDQVAVAKPQLSALTMKGAVHKTTETIRDWLMRKATYLQMCTELTNLATVVQRLEREGLAYQASYGLGELKKLRNTCTRIQVISRTGFLPAGYALLETLAALVLALLMLAKFKTFLAEVILVPFVTLIFVYMIRLIRDIDDPFEYSEDGKKTSAEVDLFPFEDFRDRLRVRLTALEAKPASAVTTAA